jgi:hypothetical protein
VQAPADADLSPYLAKKKGSPFAGVGAATLQTFQANARLLKHPQPIPYLTSPVALPVTDVELFFDIDDCTLRDLVYLHGFVIREAGDSGRERFVGIFADRADPDAEREAFAKAYAGKP